MEAANMRSCQRASPMATQSTTSRPVSPSSAAFDDVMMIKYKMLVHLKSDFETYVKRCT